MIDTPLLEGRCLPLLESRWLPIILFSALFAVCVASTAYAAREGYFTKAQAQAGSKVYDQKCAPCHGPYLQGRLGPALEGPSFADTSKYFDRATGTKLYNFIKTNMPQTAPGSLSKKDYLDVFAFILKRNGFQPGNKPLAESALKKIKLLPLPKISGF